MLACLAYIDLNPVHAGLATCLSECDHTSVQQRLHAVGKEHARELGVDLEEEDNEDERTAQPKLAPMSGEQADHEYIDPLPITLADYIKLVRHTGQALRRGKRGALPMELSETLKAFKLDDAKWLKTIANIPSRYAMLGERHLIDAEAKRRGVRASGTGWSRQAYRAA